MGPGAIHARRNFGTALPIVSGIALALTSCTSMLGIDGEYVLRDEPSVLASGGSGTGGVLVIGSGGAWGMGGAATGGVVTGAGGFVNPSSAGGAGGSFNPPLDTGGTCSTCPPPVTTTCPSGTYAGNMNGEHSSSTLFGFRLKVEGTVTISVSPGPGTTAGVSGDIQGSAIIGPNNSVAPFTAKLTGAFDCAEDSLKGSIKGSYTVAPGANPVPFEGTHDGTFANGVFNGTWSEHETSNPSMSQYYGSGDWDAAFVGP